MGNERNKSFAENVGTLLRMCCEKDHPNLLCKMHSLALHVSFWKLHSSCGGSGVELVLVLVGMLPFAPVKTSPL